MELYPNHFVTFFPYRTSPHYEIHCNKKTINKYCGSDKNGIPQGTAIRAILSNIYSIYFDVYVRDLINRYGGTYRRYSDDFIVGLPAEYKKQLLIEDYFIAIVRQIFSLIEKEGLLIEQEKTNTYYYNQGAMVNLQTKQQDKLDNYRNINRFFEEIHQIWEELRTLTFTENEHKNRCFILDILIEHLKFRYYYEDI